MADGGFMDFFDVDVAELSRAAEVARTAAEKAVGVDLTEPLSTAASGMNGAQAAAALERVGERWRELSQRWSGLVLQHAVELESARARYETGDSETGRGFTWLGDRL